MNDEFVEVREPGMGVEIHGPFLPEHRVTLNGYRVPYLTVVPRDDGLFNIIIDHRFGIHLPVSKDELDNWMPILANAMAVAAGYPCFGADVRKMNPFNVRMAALGSMPVTDAPRPDLTVIDGGNNKD